MDWIDVAGLAKGAHRGEGLGNFFLGTLRHCDALCHIVREFEDSDIVHVDGRVDPVMDVEAINMELSLADLTHVQRRLEKKTCTGQERETLEKIEAGLINDIPARALDNISESDAHSIKSMGLLTLKPVVYVLNVDEVDFLMDREKSRFRAEIIFKDQISLQSHKEANDSFAIASAKLDAALSQLSNKDQVEYLASMGVDLEPGESCDHFLSHRVLAQKVMEILDLGIAYTGPGVPQERSKTTKSYLFRKGSMSADAFAGRLHGDIRKGFLRAEVTPAPTILDYPSYIVAKESSGSCRMEGREYMIKSGDVVLIKWKSA
jgi:ribosome-binding ATPase YchF (GTP1/OBG family)